MCYSCGAKQCCHLMDQYPWGQYCCNSYFINNCKFEFYSYFCVNISSILNNFHRISLSWQKQMQNVSSQVELRGLKVLPPHGGAWVTEATFIQESLSSEKQHGVSKKVFLVFKYYNIEYSSMLNVRDRHIC